MLTEFQIISRDKRILFSFKAGSVSISFDEVEVYSFDLAGRLLTAWVNGQTFFRSLDNRVIKKWRDPDRRPCWKLIEELPPVEKQQFLNRTWSRLEGLRQLLQRDEASLVGAGGDYYSHQHTEQTAELLNAMGLGQGDLIYFSPPVESPTSEYAKRAAQAGIRPLAPREQQEQLEAIRSRLLLSGEQRPKVSLYDIREFVY